MLIEALILKVIKSCKLIVIENDINSLIFKNIKRKFRKYLLRRSMNF